MTCMAIGIGQRHRHGHDRQADERDRLRVDSDVRPHRQLAAVEHEGLLPDQGRRQGVAGAGPSTLSNSLSTHSCTSGGIFARG